MVTKSILSSPPRVRGEPIDIQEIEVELSSTKYARSSKSAQPSLNALASANNTKMDPNPAAATPPPPTTITTTTNKKNRGISAPQKVNDREPPKETLPKQQQPTTAVAAKVATTPERPKVMKGKQAAVPTTPKKEEIAETTPKPVTQTTEDATEPSVVEVQLTSTPSSVQVETLKSSASVAKPSVLSKVQRATSLPTGRAATVGAAAAAAAVGVAAAKGKNLKAATPSVVSAAKSTSTTKTSTASVTRSVAPTVASTAAKSTATATVASAAAKSTTPTAKSTIPAVVSAAKSKTVASAAKSTVASAAKSTTPTVASAAKSSTATVASAAKSTTPTVASAAKSTTPTVASAAKAAVPSAAKSVTPTAPSSAKSSTPSVTKSTAPTVASATSPTMASSASASTPTSSGLLPAAAAVTAGAAAAAVVLSKTPSSVKVTTPPSPSLSKSTSALVPTLSKSASAAKATAATKGTTPVKPPPPPLLLPVTPPPLPKPESRLGSGFRMGKAKSGPVNGQVVRDGKLCHVRLTLAFLTGVTAERLPEYQHLPLTNGGGGKKFISSPHSKSGTGAHAAAPTQDDLVPTGFAMLSQGDGTMALSHPMKPFDFVSNIPRQTLIWTDNSDSMSLANTQNDDDNDLSGERDDESQLTHSAGQRRLYFEVSLNREGDNSAPPEQSNDVPDDATATSMLKEVAANYSPELISIVVGLKKGEDQVIPLGLATLVVSGREVSGQHVDLPVRALTLAEREAYNMDPADKKKRKSHSFRLFGGAKRAEAAAASLSSFKNEHHSYSLAPNATLRVRLDVRSGIYREHGPALWGDLLILRPDDESRATVTVYDMSTFGDRETVKRSLIPLDDRHEYVEVLPNANGTTIISSPGGALGLSPAYSGHSKLQGRDDESLQTRFEVTSIFAASTDIRSTESTSENMSLLERLENAGICGALDRFDDRALSASNSFASTLPDIDPPELDSVKSALSVGEQFLAELPPAASKSASKSASKTSKAASRATKTSQSSAPLNVLEDDDDDEVNAGVFCNAGASKSSGADSSTDGGTRTSVTTRSLATRSVGDETYQKVKEAKETLMRYASRVGVEMEDLLDEDDSTFRRRESSTYSGSTSISR